MSFSPPPLPPWQPEWHYFQVWWQQVISQLATNLADITAAAAAAQVAADAANAAIADIADMHDDNILTPDKKPVWIFMHSSLTGEQAALDTQATALGITTEKTTYDNAVSALTTHLGTLTTPVAWNNLTGNTTIVGTTFRSKFDDLMIKKQALINKLASEASKQGIVINPIPDVVILANSAGTIKAGELTKTVNLTASNGLADVTTAGTWARTVTAGVTCTIAAGTGVLSITAMSATEQVTIPISFTYAGVTRTGSVHVIKSLDTAEAANTSVVINPNPDVIIYADSAGVVKSGETPRQVGLSASSGLANVTTLGTWTRTVTPGVTCTMGASTGILNITALTVNEVNIPVTFTYGGITRTATVHVIRTDDQATLSGSSGSAGSMANTTTLGGTTGTAYDLTNAISATLTVTVGPAGSVTCTASIGFKRSPGTVAGETGAVGKWQYRVPAGVWGDISTEVAGTNDAFTETNSGEPTVNLAGSLSVTRTQTGLTTGSNYEFRFAWKHTNVAGDIDVIYRSSGTLTADGTA